ncbi:MAG: phosphoadenylyl-sulfate reductase [Pseudomonadota bacterium]
MPTLKLIRSTGTDANTALPVDFDATRNDDIEALRLPPDADLAQIVDALPRIRSIFVEFAAFTDGRGFSLARLLRQRHGYDGLLVADGQLIPDQFAFALQCGFDAVRIADSELQRHTPEAWDAALDDFDLTYQRGYAVRSGPATNIFDARLTALEAGRADDPFFGLSAEAALAKAINQHEGDIFLASSLGADSAVLLHMVSRIRPDLPIYFLDTGKHFRQTLAYRDTLIDRLGLTNFINVRPDREEVAAQDPTGELHELEPDACCALRKVRPLAGAVGHFSAQITGRKRYQTPERAEMPIYERLDGADGAPGMVKINPLAYWSARDVTDYIRRHDLPPHPMFALGYPSIGCQPCTTRVSEGEDPRAGRWRNQGKTECGIHMVDGKWQPLETKKTFEAF